MNFVSGMIVGVGLIEAVAGEWGAVITSVAALIIVRIVGMKE